MLCSPPSAVHIVEASALEPPGVYISCNPISETNVPCSVQDMVIRTGHVYPRKIKNIEIGNSFQK